MRNSPQIVVNKQGKFKILLTEERLSIFTDKIGKLFASFKEFFTLFYVFWGEYTLVSLLKVPLIWINLIEYFKNVRAKAMTIYVKSAKLD